MDFLQLFSLNSFETLLMHRYNDYFIAVKIQVSMLSLTACVSEGKFGALMNKIKEKEDCYTSTLVIRNLASDDMRSYKLIVENVHGIDSLQVNNVF